MDKLKFEFLEESKCSVNINSVPEFISVSLYLGKYFTILLNYCGLFQKNCFENF